MFRRAGELICLGASDLLIEALCACLPKQYQFGMFKPFQWRKKREYYFELHGIVWLPLKKSTGISFIRKN